jgi:aminopeptidase
MATYLATVQIGRYSTYDLESAAECRVPQRAVVPAKLRSAVEHDLARQPQMMALFERLFGPYPFREYLVVVAADDLDIPVEAQGLSVFGRNHVDGSRGSERLVAHELAHQWFGNSLTVSDWRDIWLNEGFACYAEWLWSEESGGPTAEDKAQKAWSRLNGLAQDLLLADPGPVLMFDDRLYKRGAVALHAMRTRLGDDTFFTLVRRWTTAHRYGCVTTSDFLQTLEIHGGLGAREELCDWLLERALPPWPCAELPEASRPARRQKKRHPPS